MPFDFPVILPDLVQHDYLMEKYKWHFLKKKKYFLMKMKQHFLGKDITAFTLNQTAVNIVSL